MGVFPPIQSLPVTGRLQPTRPFHTGRGAWVSAPAATTTIALSLVAAMFARSAADRLGHWIIWLFWRQNRLPHGRQTLSCPSNGRLTDWWGPMSKYPCHGRVDWTGHLKQLSEPRQMTVNMTGQLQVPHPSI